MIFVIDVKGTLDKGGQHEWADLIQKMKQNGDVVCVATSGFFGSREEQDCGFKKADFSKVYHYAEKGLPLIKDIQENFNVTNKEICFIDNHHGLVSVLQLVGVNAIWHNSVSETRKKLIEDKLLI